MIVYALIVVVAALAVLISWLAMLRDRARSNVGGPFPMPIIGSGHKLAVDSHKFLQRLNELEDEHNHTAQIYLFSKRYVLSKDPKVLEAILTDTESLTKGASYRFLQPWLGDGLLTSTGQKWKAHRKFLTPAFHFNILQNFLPLFCNNGKVLRDKLRGLADGSDVDLFSVTALLALDNVYESILGVPLNAQSERSSEVVKSIDAISSIVATRMRNVFFAPDMVFNLLPSKRIQDKALHFLNSETSRVIKTRREELEKSHKVNQIPDMTPDYGSKNRYAFLDLLLLAEVDGKKISDVSIREEVNTFMFEGQDTTSSGMAYCIYSLSHREDIQDKIYQEQKTILGADLDRDPTYNEIQQMKYLELVIKESLRLFPSVPIVERCITRDTNLAGWHLPQGTNLVMDFYNMQRSPELYEDPLEFRPERWESTNRHPFHWLSFSAGPRNCIGQKFAILEMKVTIATVVKNFKILPSFDEPEPSGDLILRSRNGVKVKIIPRN